MKRLLNGKALFLVILATIAMLALAGCAGAEGQTGPTGSAGVAGPAGGAGPAGPAGVRGPAGGAGPAGPVGPSLNSSIKLSPGSMNAGPLNATVYGSGFANGERVVITLTWSDGSKTSLGSTDADAGGVINFAVSTTDALTDGVYGVVAIGNAGSSASEAVLVGQK